MHEEAALFKVLGDPTRLRLAVLLAVQGETCVCKLADALDAKDFSVSRHLSIMRASGLVEARREGTWMHYKLAEPRSDLEAGLQKCLRECLIENVTSNADIKRLGKALCSR